MSKEKVSNLDKEKKEVTFYYEVIGIILVLISLIAMIRLGKAGIVIALVFKLLFGDWYFLFILFVFYFGIRLLLSHSPIKIKNMRFIGYTLISICLLILSHGSFYQYINKYSDSPFKTTLSFYLDAFKYQNFDDLSGGGIFGAIFFQFLYILFSRIGTILIAIIILYVGICFIFQKTVFEFTKKILSIFKNIFKKGIRIRNIFKYEIKQYSNRDYHIKLNAKWFKDVETDTMDEINQNYEELVFFECKKAINSYHFFYDSLTKISNGSIFIIIIKTYHIVNIDSFHRYLKNNISFPFLLRKNPDQIYLEFNAKKPKGNSFSKTLSLNKVIIGIDPFNDIIEYDLNKTYLILGINYYDFLRALVFLIINCYNKYGEILIFDEHFENYPAYKRTIKDLPKIFDEAEEKLKKIIDYKCSNYLEYNQLNNTMKINDIFIIINQFEIIYRSFDFKDLFFKFLNIAKVTGYHIIIFANDDLEFTKLENQQFDVKIITKNNYEISKEYLNPVLLDAITETEGIYLESNEEVRIALTKINQEELKILSEKLKEKRK